MADTLARRRPGRKTLENAGKRSVAILAQGFLALICPLDHDGREAHGLDGRTAPMNQIPGMEIGVTGGVGDGVDNTGIAEMDDQLSEEQIVEFEEIAMDFAEMADQLNEEQIAEFKEIAIMFYVACSGTEGASLDDTSGYDKDLYKGGGEGALREVSRRRRRRTSRALRLRHRLLAADRGHVRRREQVHELRGFKGSACAACGGRQLRHSLSRALCVASSLECIWSL